MAAGTISQAEVDQLNQSYQKIQEAEAQEDGGQLERELGQLQQMSDKYQATGQRAAEESGLDLDAMRSEFTKITDGADQDSFRERFLEAQTRWQGALTAAGAATGIDPTQARADALAVLDSETQARVAKFGKADEGGLAGFSYTIDDFYVPPKAAPVPTAATQSMLSAPYTLSSAINGATANRSTGTLDSYNSMWVGWRQQLASVGSTFYADASVRRIRLESTVNIGYWTVLGAIFGYASGEVLINLKALDGTQLKASNRLSLVRTIAALFWVTSDYGSGQYTLSCEFNHSYGTPRNYAAMVELETWAGGAGLLAISPAIARGYGGPSGINVILMR